MWDRVIQFLLVDLSKEQVRGVTKFCYRGGIIVHVLFACGWLSLFGLSGFARATETDGLRGQIAALRSDFTRAQAQDRVDKLEEEIAGIDQEMFAIRAKLLEVTHLGQTADSLYGTRLSTLETKKAAVLRELEGARRHPALNPGG